VNRGEFQFTVDDEGNIIYGLGAIKGLGEGPIESILEARKEKAFSDLFDFCDRVDLRKVNKRALEALVRSGAFVKKGLGAELDYDRAVMAAAIPEAVRAAEQSAANENAGMVDLFGGVVPSGDDEGGDPYKEFRKVRRWPPKERLNGERDTLGLYLTGHPIDEYVEEIRNFTSARIHHLRPERKKKQKVAGLVVALRVMKTKRGDTMAIVSLDDRSGRIEVAVFSDVYLAEREKIVKDAILVIEGEVSNDDFSGALKMRADAIETLAEARNSRVKGLRIELLAKQLERDFTEQLASQLMPYKEGACPVTINFGSDEAKVDLRLGEAWSVDPSDDLVQVLRTHYGRDQVQLVYTS
jgi:DNA polymerase-3 subunit alpha